MTDKELHFDVSTGLKRVLGSELITDDEVAIFEMVKNSFDAGATEVQLYFDKGLIVVADNGSGMDYDDLRNKWLFVAYSAKRSTSGGDFRDVIASRAHYAGSKGIGRFSTDRLGEALTLQTKSKKEESSTVHRVDIDWSLFDKNDKEHFEHIPVQYASLKNFKVEHPVQRFANKLEHGTIIEIRNLQQEWSRTDLQSLKASLAKLINPFGASVDKFSINITAPREKKRDARMRLKAEQNGVELSSRDVVNGKVGNFIFSALQGKTTFLSVELQNGSIVSQLMDRGELIYRIKEANPYGLLEDSGFRCELYYLNKSAKLTFARRVGIPSVQFGSVFLFRNNFRVFPIGEETDDWFGYNRRKQQGYNRYLGSRELIGRVDVFGSDADFQEASSRNQGLIETDAVLELKRCFMEHCLKRLEKYVVPVSWPDKAEATTSDISRLLTDPGKARVTAAVGSLVENPNVELLQYSKKLINLINERSDNFERSLDGLKSIANTSGDKELLQKIEVAEKRFEELQKSEAEARKVAQKEREAAEVASQRALRAEREAKEARVEADIERRRAHFLDHIVSSDVKQLLSLQHQITIHAVDINQQIENLLQETAESNSISRATLVKSLEQISFLNKRVQAISKFAAVANFELDSGTITEDIASFFVDYINKIAKNSGSARTKIEVVNEHEGLQLRFNPMDAAIIVDNFISNARKSKATRVKFELRSSGTADLEMIVSDNGSGLDQGVDPRRIFDMGYTTTDGSGLGLYHVRQVLGEMNGSVELDSEPRAKGLKFVVKIARLGSVQ